MSKLRRPDWESKYWGVWGAFKKAFPDQADEATRRQLTLTFTGGRTDQHRGMHKVEFNRWVRALEDQMNIPQSLPAADEKDAVIEGILRRVSEAIGNPEAYVLAVARRVCRDREISDWRALPTYRLKDVIRALE